MVVQGKKLLITLLVLLVTFFAELIGGYITGSLSLMSDSVHVLSDVLSLGLAYGALSIAHRKVPTDRMSYGYHRLEVLSANFNGAMLVGISIFIFYESYQRYLNPEHVEAKTALAIAFVGFIINILVASILHSDPQSKHDVNFRGAYMHVVGDTLASIAVIIGMLGIIFTGYSVIDPIAAFIVSAIILVGAVRVITEGTGILLQQSPEDLEKIRLKVRQIEEVVDIDDFRLWQVCSQLVVGTAHIVTTVEKLDETERIRSEIRQLLEQEYNVRHLTLEFETVSMSRTHSHKLDHHHRVGV